MTLLHPFIPRSKFDWAEQKIQTVIDKTRIFDITLNSFQCFHHGMEQYSIWLAPDPSEPVIDLQCALVSIFPSCNDVSDYPSGYKPHLTVGQVDGKLKMEKLIASLQLSWRPLTFTVSGLHLIYRGRTPDDIFRIDREIEFGG